MWWKLFQLHCSALWINLCHFQVTRPSRSFFNWGTCPILLGLLTTFVHIQASHEREWEYINRKGRHSINIQLVGDADHIITNCVVKWPGSVHGVHILRESVLYREHENNQPDGIILGDSTYPPLPWLMTRFIAPSTPGHACYNTAHCKTRCTIERLSGVFRGILHALIIWE